MKKFSELIGFLEDSVIVLLISSLIVIVVMQVLFRSVFGNPLTWSEEFAKLCLIWLGLFAAVAAHRRSEHIVITTFATYFPVKLIVWIDLFVHIISVAFFLFMIVYGFQLASQQFISKLPALRVPYAMQTLPVAISGLLMLYHTVCSMFKWRPKYREAAAK